MIYKFSRFFLFLLPAECAHFIALELLKILYKINLLNIIFKKTNTTHITKAFGLKFKNPVGIAAGLDKNGDYIDCLSALGAGFIEVGAVTPEPQFGNDKPRLFRLREKNALINRMGFNNKGVNYLVKNLKNKSSESIVGVNIGKNKQTPLINAKEDYAFCLEKVYPYADFVTINISSPNTPDLRKLQDSNYLFDLLSYVLHKRDELRTAYDRKMPILVKISPDMSDAELLDILKILNDLKIDGIIATNTSISRVNVSGLKLSGESGGLSGAPIKELSLRILEQINDYEFNHLDIISCGGIDSDKEAISRFNKGAKLIQIYTGLIYEGPSLIQKCIKAHNKFNG